MPWGLFGPISFQTRRGTRITFVAGFITLPFTAWSLWKIFGTYSGPKEVDQGSADKSLPPPEVDLTGQ